MATQSSNMGTVLVAGSGDLPRIIAERLERDGYTYSVLRLPGAELDWLGSRTALDISLENFIEVLEHERGRGRERVILAGGVRRPHGKRYRNGGSLSSQGINLAAGDDNILTQFVRVIERLGFVVVGAHELIGSLLSHRGVLTIARPSDGDREDAEYACRIVDAVGRLDIGQATVVAQRICLAVEDARGTDFMLRSLVEHEKGLRPYSDLSGGILYKGRKPGQDWRVDLPAIGPETVLLASEIGLSGIVIESGGVLMINKNDVVRIANEKGLFVWSRT